MLSRISSGLQGEINPLYRLRLEIESQGHAISDLVAGNVTRHGIVFPAALLEDLLSTAARRTGVYIPDPLGRLQAREAIARYYGQSGVFISPNRILLTPGTSISYWYSFKLIADHDDEILCPRPSYPLFDYIAALSGVKTVSYPLDEARCWRIDLDRLESMISTRTRGIVLISPHNPTGHVADIEELEGLAEIARRHRLALISDEVFGEFLLHQEGRLPRPAAVDAPLVVTLNGFSKMFALPGLKLGWMALSGDPGEVAKAMSALELISDTFLPVSEIVQDCVPKIFEGGRQFLSSYAAEIRNRWGIAARLLSGIPGCSFVEPFGGFYVTLGIGEIDEEEAAEELLREAHLLVHPGHFYDIDPQHLVLSFVQEPEVIRAALTALARVIAEMRGE
jgi:alanine-synthesizing transaminase